MNDLVVTYLDSNYFFSLSTLVSFKLIDKFDYSEVGLKKVMSDVKNIFDIDDETWLAIWEKWSENKAIEINNRITEFRHKVYEATGYNVELTVQDMNKILYLSPDEVFDSKQYDFSTPKSNIY